MKNLQMKNRGITLVALVITIILLLILAGITISQLSGSGLFENAKLAEQKSKEAQEKEEGVLSDYENKIGDYIDGNRSTTAKKVVLFEGVLDTVNDTKTFSTNEDFDFYLVTCRWYINSSEDTYETWIVPSEDLGIVQRAERYSDNDTSYHSRIFFTIQKAGITLTFKAQSKVSGTITRVIGVKL